MGTKRQAPNLARQFGLHALRVTLLAAIVLLIHAQQRKFSAAQFKAAGDWSQVSIDLVQKLLPSAASLQPADDQAATCDVLDAAGQTIGQVLQTATTPNQPIGFSGPSNLLIACDAQQRIVGLAVLSSRDTVEHVKRVVGDARFLHQFDGLTLHEAASRGRVDAVSGATLTSYAMAEAVMRRLGGTHVALKFPQPVTAADLRLLFPQVAEVEADRGEPSMIRVRDAAGQPLGWALRTSPAADNIVGYQGPTDALVGFDTAGRIIGIAVRKSYDNEPYVGYVRDDEYFRTLLNGKTVEQLAGLDLQAAGVEGVSGATMTSQAVARGLVAAAQRQQQGIATKPLTVGNRAAGSPISAADWGGLAVIAAGIVVGFTNLRGNTWVRRLFPLLVFGYLGLVNGMLLSQAQFVGWSQAGVPHGALGLICLTAAAVVLPIVRKRNVYCSHLCPHGAAQQLLHQAIHRRVVPTPAVKWGLRLIVPGLLALSLLVAMLHWPLSLVDVEPFDAYVIRVAGWCTIGVAMVSLVASCFVPMAYCRYGCPTGALLEYLRRNARSDRLTPRDGFATVMFIVAVTLYWLH